MEEQPTNLFSNYKRFQSESQHGSNLTDFSRFNNRRWAYIITKGFSPRNTKPVNTTIGTVVDGITKDGKTVYILYQDEPYFVSPSLDFQVSGLTFKNYLSTIIRQLVIFRQLNTNATEHDVELFLLSMANTIFAAKKYDLTRKQWDDVITASKYYFEEQTAGVKYNNADELLTGLNLWKEKHWFVPYYEEADKRTLFNNSERLVAKKRVKSINDIIDGLIQAEMFVSKETIQDHLDFDMSLRTISDIMKPRKQQIKEDNMKYFGHNTFKKYNDKLQSEMVQI